MLPYFVLVGVPALIALYKPVLRPSQRRQLNLAVIDSFFFIWLILLCLRNEYVGCDLYDYKNILFVRGYSASWTDFLKNAFNLKTDIGFAVLSKLLRVFTTDFRWMLILVAILSVVPIWYLYRKEITKFPFLTVSIFLIIGLFPMYFSGLRQILAMSFVVPIYYFTKNKRLFPFLLMVLLAFFFHRSAFVLLVFYPVYWIKIKSQKTLLLILPFIAIIFAFRTRIFSALSTVIADVYTTDMEATGAFSILLLLLLFYLFSFLIPVDEEKDTNFIGLRNLLLLSTVLQMFASVHFLAMRMNYYYLILFPILIPKVIEYSSIKNKALANVALYVMVFSFIILYFYNAYTGTDILRLYPYYPLWRDI